MNGVKRYSVLLILAAIVIITVTRGISVSHEMFNHPDEVVFIEASASLAGLALNSTGEFKEYKPYPQGSFIFYAPFQILAKAMNSVFPERLFNRIGAIIYFMIGCILGIRLVQRIFGKSAATCYLLLVCFSLFHIEQSRYGTGDAISFALLMIVVYTTFLYLTAPKQQVVCILISFIFTGFLASIKYPLLYFCAIPISGVVLRRTKGLLNRGLTITAGMLLAVLAFWLFSPGVAKDIGYLKTVVDRETKAYLHGGNQTELGGLWNHIFQVLCYWTLYSDILFSPLFCFIGVKCIRGRAQAKAESVFFSIILPIILLLFLLYNLFVKLLALRTLYPFFCLSLIYVARGLSEALKHKKLITMALIAVMIVRGLFYVYVMIPYSNAEYLTGCIEQAIDISGGKRIIGLALDTFVTGKGLDDIEYVQEAQSVELSDLKQNGFPTPQAGDVVITGSLEFGKAAPYLFDIDEPDVERLIEGWQSYKARFKNAYVGQSYPQYYGLLFGFWVKGTNVSEFDFPMNYVYAFAGEDDPPTDSNG